MPMKKSVEGHKNCNQQISLWVNLLKNMYFSYNTITPSIACCSGIQFTTRVSVSGTGVIMFVDQFLIVCYDDQGSWNGFTWTVDGNVTQLITAPIPPATVLYFLELAETRNYFPAAK